MQSAPYQTSALLLARGDAEVRCVAANAGAAAERPFAPRHFLAVYMSYGQRSVAGSERLVRALNSRLFGLVSACLLWSIVLLPCCSVARAEITTPPCCTNASPEPHDKHAHPPSLSAQANADHGVRTKGEIARPSEGGTLVFLVGGTACIAIFVVASWLFVRRRKRQPVVCQIANDNAPENRSGIKKVA